MRQFGGDPRVLESPIDLYGVPFRVAGVTPEAFRGVNLGEPVPDIFIPILSGDAISPGIFRATLALRRGRLPQRIPVPAVGGPPPARSDIRGGPG